MDSGSRIVASRLEGCPEHADINHGYVRPNPREAGTAEDVKRLRDRLREHFIPHVAFYDDPDPAAEHWTGPPLVAPE
ncbi:MAG: hypothetical protein ACRED0_06965 [Gammaproteobacteria bacterium]